MRQNEKNYKYLIHQMVITSKHLRICHLEVVID